MLNVFDNSEAQRIVLRVYLVSPSTLNSNSTSPTCTDVSLTQTEITSNSFDFPGHCPFLPLICISYNFVLFEFVTSVYYICDPTESFRGKKTKHAPSMHECFFLAPAREAIAHENLFWRETRGGSPSPNSEHTRPAGQNLSVRPRVSSG